MFGGGQRRLGNCTRYRPRALQYLIRFDARSVARGNFLHFEERFSVAVRPAVHCLIGTFGFAVFLRPHILSASFHMACVPHMGATGSVHHFCRTDFYLEFRYVCSLAVHRVTYYETRVCVLLFM